MNRIDFTFDNKELFIITATSSDGMSEMTLEHQICLDIVEHLKNGNIDYYGKKISNITYYDFEKKCAMVVPHMNWPCGQMYHLDKNNQVDYQKEYKKENKSKQ